MGYHTQTGRLFGTTVLHTLIVWAIIAALFVVAAAAEYYVWPSERVTILYALPLAVAARYVSQRAIIGLGVLAVALNTPTALAGRVAWELSAIIYVSLALIAFLAFWVARGRDNDAVRLQQIARAQEQLREFMGMVVHDLRNPLGIALGYVQFAHGAVSGKRSKQVAERLTKAERALETMRRLIDDLADAVRIGGNRFVIRPIPVDLAELTRAVVEEQSAFATTHAFIVEVPDQLCVKGDADRLRQVIVNFLSNAVKYSPAHTKVVVKVEARGNTAILAVSDQGPGIPVTARDDLFRPFSRLTTTGESTGTGLGLYITKGIVEAHQGRIWVDSADGHGSTFFVELPRCSP